jgi:hypothetical protein
LRFFQYERLPGTADSRLTLEIPVLLRFSAKIRIGKWKMLFLV